MQSQQGSRHGSLLGAIPRDSNYSRETLQVIERCKVQSAYYITNTENDVQIVQGLTREHMSYSYKQILDPYVFYKRKLYGLLGGLTGGVVTGWCLNSKKFGLLMGLLGGGQGWMIGSLNYGGTTEVEAFSISTVVSGCTALGFLMYDFNRRGKSTPHTRCDNGSFSVKPPPKRLVPPPLNHSEESPSPNNFQEGDEITIQEWGGDIAPYYPSSTNNAAKLTFWVCMAGMVGCFFLKNKLFPSTPLKQVAHPITRHS